MENRVYQICTNCVMDTTDSKIVFDERGVCDHCRTFYRDIQPAWHPDERGEAELMRIVEKIKADGRGKQYDCIVGMSGGVDSSYLTWLAKQKLGLKPLVFHVDGGWNTRFATENIERIVGKLGLDLHTDVIDWNEMKDLQLAYFKAGVSNVDAPQDHAFFATMYKFASKYKVKYILTGGNYSTECVRNPVEWMYYQSDARQLKDIHRKFGQIPLKTYPFTNILWHKVYLRYIRKITLIRPLDYIPYLKDDAMDFLTREFGYQQYSQKHFESQFTKFYESYWLYKKFGYDTRRVQYSSLILTGQMTRDEALEKLKSPPYDPSTIQLDFEAVANRLGVTTSELQGYMDAPNRSYRDYKSQESMYLLGARIMRILGLERGGKR